MSSRKSIAYVDFVRLVSLLLVVAASLWPSAGPTAASAALTAFVGVNVVPMDEERVLRGQTVIVRDGSIEAIGPVEEIPVPEGARVIYGRGRWLMPGLIDMHVHIRSAD